MVRLEVPADAPVPTDRPTLWLVGDSTVNNGSGRGEGGLYGWGQMIGEHFDSSRIRIENRARGGRSSRTFHTEGLWSNVVEGLKPGDFVLVQFGHNDGGPMDEGRARASIKGTGNESVVVTNKETGKIETVYTYGWYIRKFVEETKAKGATPIVLSLVPRNIWKDGRVVRAEQDYGGWAARAASASGALFIDLNELVARRYEAVGQDRVAADYFTATDHTHTTRLGARVNADAVVEGIRQLQNCPLTGYLMEPPTPPGVEPAVPETGYLFSYFIGNGEDGLHLAWSRDGYHWEALNQGRSYLTPEVGESKLMRDPCVIRGPDGTFHMVWTTAWQGQTIGYASSKDLIHWSPQRAIPVMAHEPTARNCWAPEIVYDEARDCFMIFWASTIPGRFPETLFEGRNDNNHRIYVTTTKDFESFTPTELFFDPGFNVIDSTLFQRDGRVWMVFKDETKHPTPMKNLRLAVAEAYAGPYQTVEQPLNPPGAWVEGPTTLQIGGEVLLYFDKYRDHRYGALRSRDLKTWEDVTDRISFPPGTRHGTALAVPGSVIRTLLSAASPRTGRIEVKVDQKGIEVSPVMHGVFFEDINYAADGGLYAELIQNRSFEHREALHAWSVENRNADAGVRVETYDPLNSRNPHYLRLDVRRQGRGVGVANTGFDGIPVQRGAEYRFAVHARASMGYRGGVRVILEDEQGRAIGEARTKPIEKEWQRYEATLRSKATVNRARLVVLATDEGRLDLDMISLFPKDTWQGRPNGLRADLVQMLADLKPGFIRFPGGCIVEGKDLANAYRWKDTVGDIAQRPQNWNRWQDAVATKAPHYYQTYGLGFFEFFQLCEDLGAEPVPILNCGMSCQFQDKQFVPVAELDEWVQDALDLVEFANGPVTSRWGAVRARMGHAEPFNLKYLGIGNEQWGEPYFERYPVFYAALKARHPDLVLVTTSGPGVDDQWWNLAWDKFKAGTPADIVDEHYYRPPQWFLDQAARYDRYDRKGPKVFAGEFAAHDNDRRNNLRCAMVEAAFMTGLWRNADLVRMACYAPLLAKEGFTQWRPDLIWFDNTRVYGTPSYHVQKLFSRNRPDVVLPVQVTQPVVTHDSYPGMVGVGTWNTEAEFKDIRVTRDGGTLFQSDFSEGMAGWKTMSGQWEVREGVLRQTALVENARALVGDPTWTDYTLELKARKIAGREGFLVIFQSPGDQTTTWWNIGGWANREHGLDLPGINAPHVPGSIETNRWYDIRVELKGASIKAYLDGRLIHEATRREPPPLYVAAGCNEARDQLILAIVNTAPTAVEAEVNLRGVAGVAEEAQLTVLTSERLNDENSFENPDKVAPRDETVRVDGPTFQRVYEPHSLTIVRVFIKD